MNHEGWTWHDLQATPADVILIMNRADYLAATIKTEKVKL